MAGRKVWEDDDNAKGIRPGSVTVRLVRNGAVIEECVASAENGWQYSFDNLPVYDRQGKRYAYALSEQPVSGYYAVIDGDRLINRLLVEEATPVETPVVRRPSEEELTNLIYLVDYKTPLYGSLLGTGLDLPVYPFVFAGLGCVAVVALLAGRRKRKDDT